MVKGETASGRKVVLKFAPPWLDEYRRKAFDREVQLLKVLRGKRDALQLIGSGDTVTYNLVDPATRYEVPLEVSYYAMEAALRGYETEIYGRTHQLSVLKKMEMFAHACRAISRLHREGICHRDLKPANLLVFKGRTVKVGDFGTGRLIGGNLAPLQETYDHPRGDLRYTAPELLCLVEDHEDELMRGDFYSLGAIMFETLTGQVLSEIILPLEELFELASTFKSLDPKGRRSAFQELLPAMRERKRPTIRAVGGEALGAAEVRIERLYQSLTEFDPDRRLTDFGVVSTEMDKIISTARQERAREIDRIRRARVVEGRRARKSLVAKIVRVGSFR